jgi:hypothetical protein
MGERETAMKEGRKEVKRKLREGKNVLTVAEMSIRQRHLQTRYRTVTFPSASPFLQH